MQLPKQSECLHLFGNPSLPGWAAIHLTNITPPYPLHMGNIPIHSFQVNKFCAEAVQAVLGSYWDRVGKDMERVQREGADVFSGGFNVRTMRGIARPSMHSFAIAFDFNAPKNPLGRKPGAVLGSFVSDSLFVKCWKEAGAVWGGDWTGRPDGMHFQFAIVD